MRKLVVQGRQWVGKAWFNNIHATAMSDVNNTINH